MRSTARTAACYMTARFAYVRPSPDGSLVAVTCGDHGGSRQTVWILDVATGRVVRQADVAALDGWTGEAWLAGWTTDGGVVIESLCHCDSPRPSIIAVLRADGSLALVDHSPLPARASVEYVGGEATEDGYAGATAVSLASPPGDVVASAPLDARPVVATEVSPDGNEAALYFGIQTVRLLRPGAGALDPPTDPLSIMERWYGARLPAFSCGGEERAGGGGVRGASDGPGGTG
jgi:hypothetical protein